MSPPVYPELVGLAFDWVRRPIFQNGLGAHVSGREVRVAYFPPQPIWEWDLIYDVLRDFPVGTIPSELKRLAGFFLDVHGALEPFLFRDPDDYIVVGQVLTPEVGSTVNYDLVRSFGDAVYGVVETEPVGQVDLTAPFNVYVGGILQPSSTYTVTVPSSPATPNVLSFGSAPGGAVTVDMTYRFWARFSEDYLDLEEFARLFWLLRKVTIRSVRGTQPKRVIPPVPSPPPPPPPPSNALKIDGTAFVQDFVSHTVTSRSLSPLTTAMSNDVIVLHVVLNAEGGPGQDQFPPSVLGVTGGGLNWARRGSPVSGQGAGFGNGNNFIDAETWWAPAPTPLSSAVITINVSSDLAFIDAYAFGVSGITNPLSPWDTNGSLPAVVNHLNGPAQQPSVSGVSTTSSNGMVLFFLDEFSITGATGVPAGFTFVQHAGSVQAFINLGTDSAVSEMVTTAPLSSVTLTEVQRTGTASAVTGPLQSWIVIADALQA